MTDILNDDLFQGYAYDYTALAPLAIQQGLPLEELPSIDWTIDVLEVALKIAINEIAGDLSLVDIAKQIGADIATPDESNAERSGEFVALIRSVWDRLQAASPTGRAQSLDDFASLFRTIPLPPSANVLFEDDAFAWWRVAGPNPTVITRAPNAGSLTNDALQSNPRFANDTLDALVSSGRLVVADYRTPLADLQNGNFPDGQKFAYKPIVWFGVPDGASQLVPLAIEPAAGAPIVTAPAPGTTSWPWEAAKSLAASADTNHHELIAHLGRTHLFVEPFVVATHIALSSVHPVALLLRPHFEGTIFINWAAVNFLIANKGGVDALLAGTIESARKVAVEAVTSLTFNDAIIPNAFAARGFGSDVPFTFPYRDDALAVWGALRDWVGSYLGLFYANDGAVQNDVSLQQWATLIRANDGGRVASFPAIQSVSGLADALSAIIFAASAQHAAVNFPQATVMTYTPTMPGAGYASPADAIASTSEAQWMNIMPPLDMAALQLRLTYALGSVHYTEFGRYALTQFIPTGKNVEVRERLASFHDALAKIETAIDKRNSNLPAALQYPYLKPSQIPQSINI